MTSITKPSSTLRNELALIAASRGVMNETISYDIDTDSHNVKISFVLETELLVEEPKADIRLQEPFLIVYQDINEVGITAPVVLSARDDFPRILGHLNPVRSNSPVSICLARAGLQPIYDRFGIEGVILRLRTWLRDAQTGALMADGWEPVPYASNMPTRGGLLHPTSFQEIAVNFTGPGSTTGIAKIIKPEDGDYVYIYPQTYSPDKPAHNSELSKAVKSTIETRQGVPWVFIWNDSDNPISEPIFGLWQNYKDMREALKHIGMTSYLEQVIGHVLGNGCDCVHLPDARKTLVVLIGIWRPVALADNIFGLSIDPNARRLEIKAFTLETNRHGNVIDDDTNLRAVIADPLPSRELFRWVTGAPSIKHAALVGYGSLGCAIANHLIRSGADEISVIDNDKILSHNLARHSSEFKDLYSDKVEHLERVAKSVAIDNVKTHVHPHKENILKLTYDELLTRVGDSDLLIDATADERVRGYLSKFNEKYNHQITRVEIFHQGCLGIQFVTGESGNPGLLDIYYLLCREAIDDEAIAQWLYDEHVKGVEHEELLFGFGCSSMTTRIQNYVVAQHASAFMPLIIEGLTEKISSGIGINYLDSSYHSKGWRWIDVQQFHHAEIEDAPGWTVRVHQDVLSFISDERDKALPAETGGYLYGGWDLASKQMIIVMASPLPPGSEATATSLNLGASGNTKIERRIEKHTRGHIILSGTWHSHPGQSSAMSGKDISTIKGFTTIDRELGIPTLLIIVADDGIRINMEA